jgi:hypothetical protein
LLAMKETLRKRITVSSSLNEISTTQLGRVVRRGKVVLTPPPFPQPSFGCYVKT